MGGGGLLGIREFSTAQKVKAVQLWICETLESWLVIIYLKFDFSVYKMSFM